MSEPRVVEREADPRETQPTDPSGRVVREVLGTTPGDRPIEVFRYRGPFTQRRVLVFFSIHGDEAPAAELAVSFQRRLVEEPELWRDQEICVIPVANPDGLAAGTRTNGAGVDVNRNFPATNWQTRARSDRYNPGPFAGSEVETQTLMRFIERIEPAWIVSVHAPLSCVDWDGPAEGLARVMAQANGLPARKVGYATPGSFGSWAGIDKGIPVVTLELGRGFSASIESQQLDGLLAALRWNPTPSAAPEGP